MFDGVVDGYETAVKPFVTNLMETVSGRLVISNLGWLVRSEEVHKGNCGRPPGPATAEGRGGQGPRRALSIRPSIRSSATPTVWPFRRGSRHGRPRRQGRPTPPASFPSSSTILVRMQGRADGRRTNPRDDIHYLTSRAVHILRSALPSEFGAPRISSPGEIQRLFFPPPRHPSQREPVS